MPPGWMEFTASDEKARRCIPSSSANSEMTLEVGTSAVRCENPLSRAWYMTCIANFSTLSAYKGLRAHLCNRATRTPKTLTDLPPAWEAVR
jgi:hypothetical protein